MTQSLYDSQNFYRNLLTTTIDTGKTKYQNVIEARPNFISLSMGLLINTTSLFWEDSSILRIRPQASPLDFD